MTPLSTSHVFISYSRKNTEVMQRIVLHLRRNSINAWVDNEKLVPGTPIWEREIEKAIKGASALVVVLSPDAKESVWVLTELTLADEYKKRVFPVLVGGDFKDSIPFRLVTRQFVDLRANESMGLEALTTAIRFYLAELTQLEEERQAAERETERQRKDEERIDKEKLDSIRLAEEKLHSDKKTVAGPKVVEDSKLSSSEKKAKISPARPSLIPEGANSKWRLSTVRFSGIAIGIVLLAFIGYLTFKPIFSSTTETTLTNVITTTQPPSKIPTLTPQPTATFTPMATKKLSFKEFSNNYLEQPTPSSPLGYIEIMYPKNGATIDEKNPMTMWDVVPNAAYYVVSLGIFRPDTGTGIWLESWITNSTSFTSPTTLSKEKPYSYNLEITAYTKDSIPLAEGYITFSFNGQ